MRRLHWIFAVVVVTAFASAFLAERSRRDERPSERGGAVVLAGLEGPAVRRGSETLRGAVVDAAGRPVAGASVQARRATPDPTALEPLVFDRTGPDGAFELRRLEPGAHRLVVFAAGARAVELAVDVPAAEPVRVRLDEPWEDLPAAPDVERVALAGRIERPAGAGGAGGPHEIGGLEGYEVRLLPRGEEALWRGAQERRATTDAAGNFAIQDLAVADHDLEVLPPWARGGSWPVLARRALDAEDARAAADAADEEGAALTVALAVGALEGRLVSPQGLPIEGALLRCRPVGAPLERAFPPASTDADGRFALRDLPAPPEGALYVVEVFAGAARREVQAEVRPGARREIAFGPLETR